MADFPSAALDAKHVTIARPHTGLVQPAYLSAKSIRVDFRPRHWKSVLTNYIATHTKH